MVISPAPGIVTVVTSPAPDTVTVGYPPGMVSVVVVTMPSLMMVETTWVFVLVKSVTLGLSVSSAVEAALEGEGGRLTFSSGRRRGRILLMLWCMGLIS